MQFNMYKDIREFYRDTYDVLMRHEVQNLIILGNIILGNEGKDKTEWRDPANWIMATVTDGTSGENKGIKLTAVMTPPFNITLYATDNEKDPAALFCLVEGLLAGKVSVPGVTTEKSLAEDFTEVYTKATGQRHTIICNQRIYELLHVNPEIETPHKIRLLQESDMFFFPYWLETAMNDFFGKPISPLGDAEKYLNRINKKSYYILEDNGIPVTMACIAREMQNVCGVGMVYTP
ncbi:MAG: hypothetical protein FWB91_14440, partial [Defluviitaleaceae bacterium]|nr:hypothetical protein [Defluviitaleaceae bacterium]